MPSIEDLIPVHELEGMTTLELGAVTRLQRRSWYYEYPPCTLPASPTLLARLARLDAGEFAQVQGTVERIFEAFGDRRIHTAAAAAFRRLSTAASRRSEAGRIANQARWSAPDRVAPGHQGSGDNGPDGQGPEPPPPLPPPGRGPPLFRSPSESDPIRIRFGQSSDQETHQRSAGLNPALAPQRRTKTHTNPAPEGFASGGAALAARAQIRLAEQGRRKAEVVEILRRAHFEWADSHRRSIPRDLCERIADHDHVTPMIAAYVIQAVDDAGTGAFREDGRRLNPIGMVITQTGTSAARTVPVDVPLQFAKAWGDRIENKAKLSNAQQALEELRRSQAAGKSPPTPSAIAGGS